MGDNLRETFLQSQQTKLSKTLEDEASHLRETLEVAQQIDGSAAALAEELAEMRRGLSEKVEVLIRKMLDERLPPKPSANASMKPSAKPPK